ncbi:MAG: leucyl aminopeptidase [Candidatus Asgardarchaeia archaeon]
MKFSNVIKSPLEIKVDALAVFVFKNEKLPEQYDDIDKKVEGYLRRIIEKQEFLGNEGEIYIVDTLEKLPSEKIFLVGLGEKDDFIPDVIRRVAATIIKKAKALNLGDYAIFPPKFLDMSPSKMAQYLIEGSIMGSYEFNIYKSENVKKNPIERIFLLWDKEAELKEANSGIRIGRAVADAVNYARDLGNHPANVMTPSMLASEALKLSEAYEKINTKVFDLDEAVKMGMHAFYAVAKGSNEPAKFIVIEYNMEKDDLPLYALAGKGITFDSGGLSLKTSEGMMWMKYDMCGAAAVLGVIKAIAELDLPIRLVGVIAATENMPSGTATKPGDIVKSYSGVTIEILNTDAEGRLTLADALGYVSKNYKPKVILDLATLTGACVIALGNYATGLFTKDDTLAEKLIKAGEESWDRVWRLPIWKEYYEQIKSDFADVKNIGGRPAGAITAAAFLSKFIVGDIPWAHLDIAGTAFSDKECGYIQKGATGAGIRLIVQFLMNELNE